MIKHIVTFQLSGTPEERREVSGRFADALRALPAQIDVLQSIEVGLNENPAEDWDVVLTAIVPTMADVEKLRQASGACGRSRPVSGAQEGPRLRRLRVLRRLRILN